jgi:hypothetical protein
MDVSRRTFVAAIGGAIATLPLASPDLEPAFEALSRAAVASLPRAQPTSWTEFSRARVQSKCPLNFRSSSSWSSTLKPFKTARYAPIDATMTTAVEAFEAPVVENERYCASPDGQAHVTGFRLPA